MAADTSARAKVPTLSQSNGQMLASLRLALFQLPLFCGQIQHSEWTAGAAIVTSAAKPIRTRLSR